MKNRESSMQVQVQQEAGKWVVRVVGAKPQVFTCATEAMAVQLSRVLEKTSARAAR